jgi:diacylglycerol kinase
LNSFSFAYQGLKTFFIHEHNARVHLGASILAVSLGLLVRISALEWIAIVFAIGFVISAELINTSLESIADFVSPNWHDSIKKVKDLAAASVLVAAISAALVGGIVILPRIFALIC